MTQADQDTLNPEHLLCELNTAARGVAAASTKLAGLIKDFENVADSNGEITLGVGAEYQVALETELVDIHEGAEKAEKRPPAEDVRLALAKQRVRAKHPQLDADYRRVSAEIKALSGWISSQKQVISAKQSVLNGARAIGA